jgi:predicted benzoate:H+ symporter BenE
MRSEQKTRRYLLACVAVVCGLLVLSFLAAVIQVLLKHPTGQYEAVAGLMLLAVSVAMFTYLAWRKRFPSISEIRKAAGCE